MYFQPNIYIARALYEFEMLKALVIKTEEFTDHDILFLHQDQISRQKRVYFRVMFPFTRKPLLAETPNPYHDCYTYISIIKKRGFIEL